MEYKSINFNVLEPRLKYVEGIFMETSTSNFNSNLKRFFAYCTEVLVMRQRRDIYDQNDQMDREVPINGKIVSPDFAVDKDGTTLYIDAKATFKHPGPLKIERTVEKIKKKYGKMAEVLWVIVDNDFSKNVPKKHMDSYLWMKNDILEFIKTHPHLYYTNDTDKGFDDPVFEHLLENSSTLKDIEIDNSGQYTDQYAINREVLEHINEMQEFANLKVLSSKALANYITIPNQFPNIFKNHPFNRDLNREAYRANFKIKRTDGRKAKNIRSVIPSTLVKDVSPSTMVSYLDSIKPSRESELIKFATKMLKIEIMCPDELNHVRQTLKEMGKVKTTYDQDTRERMMRSLNTRSLYDTLKGIAGSYLDEIRHKMGTKEIKLSSHGNIVIPYSVMGYFNKQKSGKSFWDENNGDPEQFVKQGDQSVCELADYYDAELEGEFQLVFDHKRKEMKIPEYKNAYKNNPGLDSLSDDMSEEARSKFTSILQSPEFGSVHTYIQLYRDIVIAAPVSEGKRMILNSAIVRKHPEGFYYLLTPAPCDNLTGIIKIFGVLDKTNPYYVKYNKLPGWLGIYELIEIPNSKDIIFISDTFRLNMKICSNPDRMLGSFLATRVLMQNIGLPIKNWLLTSFFWDFSRQLVKVADVIMLCYKNLTSYFSFGKDVVSKKLNVVSFTDIRSTTIIFRLKTMYEDMWDKVLATHRVNKCFQDVKDPVFGFKHTGWQSYMFVCYIRNIFPGADGYDAAKALGDFYKDEIEHQDMYKASGFSAKRLNLRKSMEVSEFFKRLWVRDGEGRVIDWNMLTYHPDTCFNYTSRMVQEARLRNPNIHPSDKWDMAAMNNGASTKTYMPINHVTCFQTDKTRVLKTKYDGLVSVNTTEAIIYEQAFFREFLRSVKVKNIQGTPWSNMNIDTDKLPTVSELTLFELETAPDFCIVNMVDKDQPGAGKRAFFIQMLPDRNANQMWDRAIIPIIKKDEDDMITLSGNQKYVKSQTSMKDIRYKPGRLGVAKDATKFGDTFSIQSLIVQILAMHRQKYLSDLVTKMLLYFASKLCKRVILMPHKTASLLKEAKENTTIEFDHKRKIAVTFNNLQMLQVPDDKFRDKPSHIIPGVLNNPHFRKEVGFILGVFNMAGSLYTSCYIKMLRDLELLMGIKDTFKAQGHSDDSYEVSNLPVITYEEFIEIDVFDTVMDLIDANVAASMIRLDKDNWQYFKGGRIINLSGKVVSKIHVILGLMTPKFVSQTASVFKWLVGWATEVLQTVNYDGNVIIPFIRYCAPLGATLDGMSPGADTQAMCGRYYDLAVNGAPASLICELMVCGNFIISDSYGLHGWDRSVNEPPELGGLFWIIPSFLFQDGFTANEVRLYSSRDPKQEKLLRLMIKSDEIYKDHLPNESERASDLNTTGTDTIIKDNTEPDGFHGVEIRVDFRVLCTQSTRTDAAYSRLYQANKDVLEKELGWDVIEKINHATIFNGKMNQSAKLKKLKEKYIIHIMSKSKDLVPLLISNIMKYTSKVFVNNYVKKKPDIKIIQKLGYLNRGLSNPFTPDFREKYCHLVENLNLDYMTIKDVWDCLRSLSKEKFVETPNTNNVGHSLIMGMLKPGITDLDNIFITDERSLRLRDYDTMRFVYRKLTPKLAYSGFGYKVDLCLAAIHDMYKNGYVSIDQTVVAKNYPRLAGDRKFIEQIGGVRAFLLERGFSLNSLPEHQTLLSRLLGSFGFIGVVALPGDTTDPMAILSSMWSYNYEMRLSYVRNTRTDLEDLGKTKENFVVLPRQFEEARFDRILIFVLWEKMVNPNLSLDGLLTIGSYSKRPVSSNKVLQDIATIGFTKALADKFLTCLLWEATQLRDNGKDNHFFIKRNTSKDRERGTKIYQIWFWWADFISIHVKLWKLSQDQQDCFVSIDSIDGLPYSENGLFIHYIVMVLVHFVADRDYKYRNVEQMMFRKRRNNRYAMSTIWLWDDYNLKFIVEKRENEGENKPKCDIIMVEELPRTNSRCEILPVGIKMFQGNYVYVSSPWNVGSKSEQITYDTGNFVLRDIEAGNVDAVVWKNYKSLIYNHDDGNLIVKSIPRWFAMILIRVIKECIHETNSFSNSVESLSECRKMEIYMGISLGELLRHMNVDIPNEDEEKYDEEEIGVSLLTQVSIIVLGCGVNIVANLGKEDKLRILGFCIMSSDCKRPRPMLCSDDRIREFNTFNGGSNFEKKENVLAANKYYVRHLVMNDRISFENKYKSNNMKYVPVSVISGYCSIKDNLRGLVPYIREQPMLIDDDRMDLTYMYNLIDLADHKLIPIVIELFS